ncbi:uncharacterized protein J8A68_005201 [[Candida] subhashii]|uniref:FHA domain-containing protein n=1 Tax=[Candida] subhashii TaxID=561895 RepID=A0A8J5UVV6_9ASCO|nr:uncharacterized protein J8A68_005201 [[Candida] subhashii]KAG7661309.1 hypothetical protein J8A68_005201 [[Candida] subhashii]
MTDISISLEMTPPTQEPFPNIDIKKNAASTTNYTKNSQSRNSTSKSSNHTRHSSGDNGVSKGRKRSNSQSQVVPAPPKPPLSSASSAASKHHYGRSNHQSQHTRTPQILTRKRNQAQYYVSLLPLNDTFIKKHLPVATYPETTKLGRPTGTKHKPDVTNGYFDSRVLSRNHAQIYIEPSSGKLMLQDLGSSNGTYLNDVRLGTDPVEIQIGDIVCLGFNVQAESTHKQISLKIENINVISNTGVESALFGSIEELDASKYKHLSFVEDIYRQIIESESSATTNNNKPEIVDQAIIPNCSLDSALFGDINPNLEDNLLGLYSQTNSGIYNNSQITNSTALENVISVLVLNLSRVKQQNSSLNTLDKFFTNYRTQLNEMNRKFLDDEFKTHLTSVSDELKRQTSAYESMAEKARIQEIESEEKLTMVRKERQSCEAELDVMTRIVSEYKQQEIEYRANYQDSLLKIKVLENERDSLQATITELKKNQERREQDQEQERLNGSKGYESKEDTIELEGEEEEEEDNSKENLAEVEEIKVENQAHEEEHMNEITEEIGGSVGNLAEIEDVSNAINGFIMDLSRTPSVREYDSTHGGSRKSSIELTPPVSDSEEEEEEYEAREKEITRNNDKPEIPDPLTPEEEGEEDEEAGFSQEQSESILRKRLQSASLKDHMDIEKFQPPIDIEPFPTVSESSKDNSNLNKHRNSIKAKFLQGRDFQNVHAIAFAMSGFLVGYFLQRATG